MTELRDSDSDISNIDILESVLLLSAMLFSSDSRSDIETKSETTESPNVKNEKLEKYIKT